MSQPQSQSLLKSLRETLSKRLLGISPNLDEIVSQKVQAELSKARTPTEETYQYNYWPGFNNMSVANQQKPKPEGRVSYSMLRNFSVHYPIARSCIDYLKTKIVKLDFQILPEDENEKINPDDPRVKVIKDFFHSPLGKRSGYRQLIESIIEDYLVIGAFTLERIRTRGGQFYNELKIVDASTIQIICDDHGRIPEPPEEAFLQVINGAEKARLTLDELIYVPRGYRSNSPYGLSPIESIIVQTEAALQGALYSAKYFSDGNVPEGFGELPEGWSVKQIREFQDHFDAMISGNPNFQRKIKMVPKGFTYTPTQKPEDIGYERFELWLLQQTCSVFGVPPQDIGFTYQTNKSTGEVQQDLGEERGMKPIAQLLQQVFTDIITQDMRMQGLKFQFKDLDPVDAKEEAEVQAIKINAGIISVDEARTEQGLDPIGLSNYVPSSVILVKDLLNPPKEKEEEVEDPKQEERMRGDEKQKSELRLWRKKAKTALKRGQTQRRFQSHVLAESTTNEIYDQLIKVKTADQVEAVFAPYFDNTIRKIAILEEMADVLKSFSRTS